MLFRVEAAGRTALAALRGGPARVFAAFERSCYVETPAGIACLGGPGLGLGPLNAIVDNFEAVPVGVSVSIEVNEANLWCPRAEVATAAASGKPPDIDIPASIRKPARSFLRWLQNKGSNPDGLIGLGPGLTPAGDDFVGGAMIALRAAGNDALAGRIAAWALPLAETNTNRISRAHLECAAQGEGHEALHDLLRFFDEASLQKLARVGHTSGLDAAAGALLALRLVRDAAANQSQPVAAPSWELTAASSTLRSIGFTT